MKIKIPYHRKFINHVLVFISFLFIVGVTGCEKDEKKLLPVPETGTMTDIEGNIYRTVKIGGQWWMAENLKVRKYADGSSIPLVGSDKNDWVNANSAYCAYDNSNGATGLLYNWNAVSAQQQLAPDGWRIPSDEDWKHLEESLGMNNVTTDIMGWRGEDVGDKLKIEGITGWQYYDNVWATNESGFSAEGSSCRLFNGDFGSPGLKYNGFWWTSTSHNADQAFYRHLDYKESGVFRYHGLKKYGFSIRCIKN